MDRISLWQTVSGCGHWCGRRLKEKENSKIIKFKVSVSWWSGKSIALQLSGGKCPATPTASTALRSSPLSLIAECSCRTFDRGMFWL
ncbi:hypothetical protein [Phocaeicola coprocola]